MKPMPKRRWLNILFWILAPLSAHSVADWFWTSRNPWPGSMVIRAFFEIGGVNINDALTPYVAYQSKTKLHSGIEHGDGDDEHLDIYVPDDGDMCGNNSSSLILAGDPAVAQIASQLAGISTKPQYSVRPFFGLGNPEEMIQGTTYIVAPWMATS